MDGNSYTHGPVVRAPSNLQGWIDWRGIETRRNALLARARGEAMAGLPALVKYAEQRAKWKASDWRMSKPVSVKSNKPPKAGWGPPSLRGQAGWV